MNYSKTLLASKFWQTKSLAQMNPEEWEAVCDGCAKCCLNKFIEDEQTTIETELQPTAHIQPHEQLHYSNIACYLLNDKTCQCSQYAQRTVLVPDCVQLTQTNLADVFFMPPSCSYRRLQEGRGLPSWHPLLHKGKKTAMHQAGMSVRGKVIKDNEVDLADFEDYIVLWPLHDKD